MPHVDLLELPYFAGLSAKDLIGLVNLMQPRSYEAGQLIMQEGSAEPQPLFIATTGKLLLTKRGPDGHERNLADLEAPTLVGEIELFCQIPPVCSIKAATAVSAFTLDRPTFERLLNAQNPAIMRFVFNVARVACHRLAVADEMLAQTLEHEDLCKMRRAVFDKMNSDHKWFTTTGAFERPA